MRLIAWKTKKKQDFLLKLVEHLYNLEPNNTVQVATSSTEDSKPYVHVGDLKVSDSKPDRLQVNFLEKPRPFLKFMFSFKLLSTYRYQ